MGDKSVSKIISNGIFHQSDKIWCVCCTAQEVDCSTVSFGQDRERSTQRWLRPVKCDWCPLRYNMSLSIIPSSPMQWYRPILSLWGTHGQTPRPCQRPRDIYGGPRLDTDHRHSNKITYMFWHQINARLSAPTCIRWAVILLLKSHHITWLLQVIRRQAIKNYDMLTRTDYK